MPDILSGNAEYSYKRNAFHQLKNAQSYYVYVWAYRQDSTVLPFYVGKGTNGRGYCGRQHNHYCKALWKATKPIVCIARQGMTEADAFLLEALITSVLVSQGFQLCNLIAGGGGVAKATQVTDYRKHLPRWLWKFKK